MRVPMTSLERVLTTLSQREPDRVPLFLLLTMHGARELGLSIESYFSRPEYVVEGQLRLRGKYRNDCFYPFFHAAIELEAWGGEVLYTEDGPPNAGPPIITDPKQILALTPPRVSDSPGLLKVLEAIRGLKDRGGDEVPIIAVVMSPFSLPIMQLGFNAYFDLMFERPELFARLLALNQAFCRDWANAQLAAGATAICYFDPMSSPTIVTPGEFRKSALPIARQTIAGIKGPVAMHFASGRCEAIFDDLPQTGAAVIGVSVLDDLAALKQRAAGRLTLLGNLNGIAMRRWTTAQAEAEVKAAIAAAGSGGGFILSDNHGEIPYQVPDETLLVIADAVQRWGTYPLKVGDAPLDPASHS
ncbi:methylcobamide--CoM methyltransferase MtbA [Thiocapsa imhoffii]|uniref:Methylcobamide--CoM methyltransferase MtbA n=1 Tax=Thiocapsa imhoffii TaxID=382777 RepID=A0A9X0WKJ0_9GAMM|nr:uroporphyrinogen decarboxylase family protein [Thiocapsa imhoffii]MBK1646409.1 methylcobamide--CoM methyltransferase MtbA [Thiocapsa imhoffii]